MVTPVRETPQDAGADQGCTPPTDPQAQEPDHNGRALGVVSVDARADHDSGPSLEDPWRSRIGAVATRTRIRRRFLVDVGMLALGVAAAGLYDGEISTGGEVWAALFVVLVFFNLKVRGLYDARLRTNLVEDLSRIVAATSTSAILVVAARVVADSVDGASTQGVRLWIWATVLLSAGRLGVALLIRRRQRAGIGQLATLVVGADAVGRQIARRLAEHPELGLRPVGFVDEHAGPRDDHDDGDVPLLGTTAEVEAIVREHCVQHLIVGYAAAPPHQLTALVRRCRRLGLQVSIVPRLYEDVNRRVKIEHLGGIPLLSSQPADPKGWQFAVKYALDRITAAVLLLLISPLMALIAIAVKLSSPGPVFYRQPRVSLDGSEFVMLKFRTMTGVGERDGHSDAHWAAQHVQSPSGLPHPLPDGDRSTAIGRVLRKFSLDELPQLFNVLFGDMSIVGPRPERTAYVQLFNEHIYRYPDRHRVKSGLTGWAQVHGLRGETSLADRVEWDNYYIENWSLWLDLKILALTTPAMFGGRTPRPEPLEPPRVRLAHEVAQEDEDARARRFLRRGSAT
jgi:exopolysaccharide biosynthesis polyprenyl glycosylphosphotransferase